MIEKDLKALLEEIREEQHYPKDGFTEDLMVRVRKQRSSVWRSSMSWFLKVFSPFMFPVLFLSTAFAVIAIAPEVTSGSTQITLLALAFASCVLILFLLPTLPRKITGAQRMLVASSLLSIAAFMFVSRAAVSVFFGSDYIDFDSTHSSPTPAVVSEVRKSIAGPTGSFSEAEYQDDLTRSAASKFLDVTGLSSAYDSALDRDEGSSNRSEDKKQRRQAIGAGIVPSPATSQPLRTRELVADFVGPSFQREQYDRIYENEFLSVGDNPLSTFSIDVDTASYANVRRFLRGNQLPPKDAVRTEELLNYFKYQYPKPTSSEEPFLVSTEYAVAPWNKQNGLLKIALQGYEPEAQLAPASNLVFLIDVSGSMGSANKLPLLKNAFRLLVGELSERDRVSIVVYAGAAGEVLPPTSGADKTSIIAALDRLASGGSTAGGQGIELAYKLAAQRFIPGGNNRVILATDGDFNVGTSSNAELVRMIEQKRSSGIFLSVLGFGGGNYQDSRLEQIANKGNGNYSYIDSAKEAKKVLVHDLRGTLLTIAKDVKIQIEFNPAHVQAYRLVGYENRMLAKEDFNDDTKDAGELGAGHTVTALYEIIPTNAPHSARSVDPLKYQSVERTAAAGFGEELATVKLRYKLPTESKSRLTSTSVAAKRTPITSASENLRFASSIAQFAMLLRDSKYKSTTSYQSTLDLARGAIGSDELGYRREFLDLVETAQILSQRQPRR